MYRLVEQGHVDPQRYVQIGLRGYWPGEQEFRWQRDEGITACSCTTCASAGSARWSARASAVVGDGPVFLSVDIDVLDPAFAPGTGTPEPGGMTSADLLWACREIARASSSSGRTSSRSRRPRSAPRTSPRWSPSGSCARC